MQRRLLLCSLDGVRPDALALATTPTIDALIAGGAYAPAARSVMPSVTPARIASNINAGSRVVPTMLSPV